MRWKKFNYINIAIIGLVIIFVIIVVLGKQKDDKELQRVSLLITQQTSASNNTNRADVTEVKNVVETKVESPYEKLNNKENISVLVLGDALAEGTGLKDSEKWTTLLKTNLDSAYGINSNVKLSTLADGNVLSSWRNFSTQEDKNKYDLVILCVGENDISTLKIEEFQGIYESLIRKVKAANPSCEVILLQESSIVNNKTVPDAIKAIGDYYNLPYLDMRDAFKKSNIVNTKLTTNGILLTAQGSKIYSDNIFAYILANASAKKVIKFPTKDLLYKAAAKYDKCNLITKVDTNIGFTENGGTYTTSTKGSSITFVTEGSSLAAGIDCGVNYGKVDIYVDNSLQSSLDCYYPTKIVKNVFVLNNLATGKHTIKLVTGASSSAKATGANIGFETIYTN